MSILVGRKKARGGGSGAFPVEEFTGTSKALIVADNLKAFAMDRSSSQVILVPDDAIAPFPVGAEMAFIREGAGSVFFIAQGSATIKTRGGLLGINAQYSEATLKKVGANDWRLIGDLTSASDFLPTDLLGNAYWLDAADTSPSSIEQSVFQVSAWNDKSGNNINFTQGAGVAQPVTGIVTINGKNSIFFNGSSAFLVGSSATIKTIFYVAQLDTGFPAFASLLNEAGADNESIRMDGASLEFKGENTSSSFGDFFFPTGEIRIDGVATVNHVIALNTPFIISVVATDTPTFIPQISQNFLARFWKGKIGEVIAYDRDLSTEERLLIETYLSDKWGIVLP